MHKITTEIELLLNLLTMNPSSQMLMYITITVSLLAAWFSFGKITKALKFPMNEGWRPVLCLTLLVAVPLLTAALTRIYLAPRIDLPALSRLLPLILAVIIIPALVTPASCFLLKSKYLQTLSSFAVPTITCAVVIFLISAITGAVKEGDQGFSRTKNRTDNVNEFLSR